MCMYIHRSSVVLLVISSSPGLGIIYTHVRIYTVPTHNNGSLTALLPLTLDQPGEGVGLGGGVMPGAGAGQCCHTCCIQPQTARASISTQSVQGSTPGLCVNANTQCSGQHTRSVCECKHSMFRTVHQVCVNTNTQCSGQHTRQTLNKVCVNTNTQCSGQHTRSV